MRGVGNDLTICVCLDLVIIMNISFFLLEMCLPTLELITIDLSERNRSDGVGLSNNI
jgi:hypothetical protein